MSNPVIKGVSFSLVHTPNLVRYGSKPVREISKEAELFEKIEQHLRSYDDTKNYPPHQVFIGNLKPNDLWEIEKPWYDHLTMDASRSGQWGEIMPQIEFYGLLKAVDEFNLVYLTPEIINNIKPTLEKHLLINPTDIKRLGDGTKKEDIRQRIESGALPLLQDNELIGCIIDGHSEDENLKAGILLENLTCKASGVLALRQAFHSFKEKPEEVDIVMNCGEEGVGDRYQRGGGNLAKAMAEMCNCSQSTGLDIKAFCCGPIHSMVVAGSLIKAGTFKRVVVVGGGSLAKLGMKMRGHLAKSMPIMEDVLASFAILLGEDDGLNPQIRLDAVGKHEVGAGSSQQAIYEALVIKPLQQLGMQIPDINRYATELHNPEITEPAGSGNVPRNNYRMIAGLGVVHGQLQREDIDSFEHTFGMPGYAPTQGHVPSALPFLGHAREAILKGEIENCMFVGKGSLFLAKMSNLSDGMSFIIEKNGKE